jgi:hypothetical protein
LDSNNLSGSWWAIVTNLEVELGSS